MTLFHHTICSERKEITDLWFQMCCGSLIFSSETRVQILFAVWVLLGGGGGSSPSYARWARLAGD